MNKLKLRLRRIINKFKKNQDVETTLRIFYLNKRWGGKGDEEFNSGSGSDYSMSINLLNLH